MADKNTLSKQDDGFRAWKSSRVKENQQNQSPMPLPFNVNNGRWLKEKLKATQYGVSGVPYHAHNGLDSPSIPIINITGLPATFTEQKALILVGIETVNVFEESVAPVAGTITAFATVSNGTAGTATLWATTAGTIVALASSGTAGTYLGAPTAINAAIKKGDKVNITTTGGTMTCLVNFQFKV